MMRLREKRHNRTIHSPYISEMKMFPNFVSSRWLLFSQVDTLKLETIEENSTASLAF